MATQTDLLLAMEQPLKMAVPGPVLSKRVRGVARRLIGQKATPALGSLPAAFLGPRAIRKQRRSCPQTGKGR
jgi:hypothetical protein